MVRVSLFHQSAAEPHLTCLCAQEKEVEDLMTESFSKNFIDYEEYPQSADIQNRCVSMIGRLFNAPVDKEGEAAVGTSTVGSSEAIMLAVLAMKAAGKPWDKPNIVMSSAVQVCWEKAARYFEVEEKYVYCTPERYVIDPEETVNLVDENTIGICVILGTTYTGEYEDAKKVNDLLIEKKIDTVIHIDAASGGFVAPFVVQHLRPQVRSPPFPISQLTEQVRPRLPRCRLDRLACTRIPPQRTRLQYQLSRC
jgi:glutamate decarboxylase